MGCDEILSGLHEILQWLQQSTGMVFADESERQRDLEDGDDDWYHFETSPQMSSIGSDCWIGSRKWILYF